jgi:molybdopterin converting factor small subunit
MGKISLLFSHKLKEITGKAEEIFEVTTPLSVIALNGRLVERYGPSFGRELLVRSNELGEESPFYLVFVDGQRIPESKRRDPLIHDGSQVSFLPLISGG